MTAQRSGPGMGTEAAKSEFAAHPKDTAGHRLDTVAARLAAIDDTLESVWIALVSNTLRIDQLRAMSPHTAAIYLAGFDAGIAAQAERVRQAEHSADRYYLAATAPPEGAKRPGDLPQSALERSPEIQHRLDRAIASTPPGVEIWSPEWVEHALRGLEVGGAA